MPKIENCSFHDVQRGYHHISPIGSVLIQITDPPDPIYPTPAEDVFFEKHQFAFVDAEEPTQFFSEEHLISTEQAQQFVDILKNALDHSYDVLVHCVAGVCRSGAVVEVAEMMGFDECFRYRLPNIRVKRMLMESAGLLPVHTSEQYTNDLAI